MGRHQVAQREANHLVEQLRLGNLNLGTGSRKLLKDISYLRGDNGARVFYRFRGNNIEILAKADKTNENKVIRVLTIMYK